MELAATNRVTAGHAGVTAWHAVCIWLPGRRLIALRHALRHAATVADQLPANPIEHVSAAQLLIDAGLTDDEIASQLGLTVAEVQRLPEMQTASLSAVHVARVERALYAAALPGTGWRETATRDGPMRLEYSRDPDTAAASTLLSAHQPQRYGKRAELTVEHRYVVELPAVAPSTADWLASVRAPGGGPTGGEGWNGNAPTVPSPADFQKNSPEVFENTAVHQSDE